MEIREGEQILKTFHHHSTPFFFWVLKVVLIFAPFFLVLYLLQNSLPLSVFLLIHIILVVAFVLLVFHKSLVYWLDKLIVTNQRVIYVNWTSLFNRDESEALLNDIQDIQTKENGVISYLRFFDYGTFVLETASAKTTLVFDLAPDPEGIRQYIYHIRPQ